MTAVVSATEAKNWLKLGDSDPLVGDVLNSLLEAAIDAIEEKVGPIEPRDGIVEQVDGGTSLVLSTTPVLSVQTIVGDSGTVAASAVKVNSGAGVLKSVTGFPSGSYVVTYTAGRETPYPPSLVLAVKETLRYLASAYRSGRGNRSSGKGSDASPLPAAVTMLLQPYMGPGFS